MVLGFYLEAYQRSDSMSISISKQKKKREEEKKYSNQFSTNRIFTSLQRDFIQDSSFNSITIS